MSYAILKLLVLKIIMNINIARIFALSPELLESSALFSATYLFSKRSSSRTKCKDWALRFECLASRLSLEDNAAK